MELKIRNGDYVPDGAGGFIRLLEIHEDLAKALFLLQARRGQFPLLPNLGSRLYLLGRETPSSREMVALQYANEALEGSGMEAVAAKVTPLGDETATVAITVKLDDNYWNLEVAL